MLIAYARNPRRSDSVRAIRDLLRHQLLQEDDQGGSASLPSESELSVEYAASRNAIRLALASLQREGIIRRTPGSGTFALVSKLRISRRRHESVASTLRRGGHTVAYVPQLVEYRPAPRSVAEALGVEVGSDIAVIERKTVLDGAPMSLQTRYLPAHITERMHAEDYGGSDWNNVLEGAYGERIRGVRSITEAALADDLLAPELGVTPGTPILLRHLYTYSVTGAVMQFAVNRMRGDLIELETWAER